MEQTIFWPPSLLLSFILLLFSPRAESARAATGRRCPHSGVGEDFLALRPFCSDPLCAMPDQKNNANEVPRLFSDKRILKLLFPPKK